MCHAELQYKISNNYLTNKSFYQSTGVSNQNVGKFFSKVKLMFQRALLSYARANREASF